MREEVLKMSRHWTGRQEILCVNFRSCSEKK